MKYKITRNFLPPIMIETEGELPTIENWDKYKAYPILFTINPLPECLPQRLSINELEKYDIIINEKKELLIRFD